MTSNRLRVRLATLILALGLGMIGYANGEEVRYDRRTLPGNYVVGLYGDDRAATRTLELERDQELFEAHIGVWGDSITTFYALTFDLGLPEGIEIAGPVRWRSIHGLTEMGKFLEGGVTVDFPKDCQAMTSALPVVLGRIPLRADKSFRSGEVQVLGHKRYHVGVALCDDNQRKPIAEPSHLRVTRKLSFWDRLKEKFH